MCGIGTALQGIVESCLFCAAGDAFLAVTGSAKIKVYDRDCILRGETLQGDMYIRDQKNTKGHVSPCTYGQWHPTDRYINCLLPNISRESYAAILASYVEAVVLLKDKKGELPGTNK